MAREHWELPEEIPETSSVHDGEHEVEPTLLAKAGPLHNRCPFKTTSFLTPLLPLQPEFTFPRSAPRLPAALHSSSDDLLPTTDSLDPAPPACSHSSPVGDLQPPSATLEAPTSAQVPVVTSPVPETPVAESPAPGRYPTSKRGHSVLVSHDDYPDDVPALKKLCMAKDKIIHLLEDASSHQASQEEPKANASLGEACHLLLMTHCQTLQMIINQRGNASNN